MLSVVKMFCLWRFYFLCVCHLHWLVYRVDVCSAVDSKTEVLHYERINEIRETCARRVGLEDFYDMYDDDEEFHEEIWCAAECEFKERKLLNDRNELLKDKFSAEYHQEYSYNNKSKDVSDAILRECLTEYSRARVDKKCSKSFRFAKCLHRRRNYYNSKEHVKDCITSWDDSDEEEQEYRSRRSDDCILADPFCFIDISKHINDHGLQDFERLCKEFGLLESHPQALSELMNGLQDCETERKSVRGRKCRKEIASFACEVAEFQKVFPFME